jgi:hypothetical protein
MTRFQTLLAVARCLTAGTARADEKISARDVPEVVRKAFASAYPTAKVNKWEKETKNGKPVFEAETTDGKLAAMSCTRPMARSCS